MIELRDLIGTWRFIRDGKYAFLHFTYTQAFDYLEDDAGHQLMRLWYELEDRDRIRFRNHRHDEGWTCGIGMEGPALVITAGESRTICMRAVAEEIPTWFQKELARA